MYHYNVRMTTGAPEACGQCGQLPTLFEKSVGKAHIRFLQISNYKIIIIIVIIQKNDGNILVVLQLFQYSGYL
jgi:hypothetical protein